MADMTPTTKEALKPCPFCRSTDLTSEVDEGIAYTKCKGCFATGPGTPRRASADNDDWQDPWNDRPTTTPDGAVEVVERLREAAWRVDSHEVTLDETVVFGVGYNFEGLENGRLEYAGRLGWAVIWPEDWPHNMQWRYYCEPDGVMPTRPLPNKLSAMLAAEDIVEGGTARALPQPVASNGFAAGVAACREAVEKRIKKMRPIVRDMPNNERAGAELDTYLSLQRELRQLSPTAHDKALVEAATALHKLANELCGAVDAEGEDVGGHRGSLTILKEFGPATDALAEALESYGKQRT